MSPLTCSSPHMLILFLTLPSLICSLRVHAEVVLSYGELSSMYNVEGGEGISLSEGDEISVSSLGLGGYMMIYLDGREHQTMFNGSSFHTVRLLEDVAFTDERQRQSLIVLVQFELESLVGGIHSVEIHLGSNGPDRISYPPCQFWFLVETQEVRGERESWWLTQSGLLMSRIQELEEQVLFLRSQLESHDVKHKRIQERKSRAPKHFVFELGANDGAWIRDFCEKNPGFQPHIFEPQPRFAQPLSDIARKFNGHFHQKAIWKHDGEKIRFHAHSDEGGIGSSIMNDHAYHQCGSKVPPSSLLLPHLTQQLSGVRARLLARVRCGDSRHREVHQGGRPAPRRHLLEDGHRGKGVRFLSL